MPDLYTLFADQYSDLFPLEPTKVSFLQARIPPSAPVLDLGCATGDLARALALRGHPVTGLDLNARMIDLARQRQAAEGVAADFQVADIRHPPVPGPFGAALCLGNTVPHLPPGDRPAFFQTVRSCLSPGAPFVVQLLNYDKILTEGAITFAPLETPTIHFHRRYRHIAEAKVTFEITLQDKSTGQQHTDTTPLYPFRRTQVEELLQKSGWTRVEVYEDFQGTPAREESFSLVFVGI